VGEPEGSGGSPRSAALFERALRVIPGGVNSPVRSFRSVGGHPYFVARGEGAYVWDADGRRLLDFVQSYGASILGHAHPSVVRAVDAAASLGTTFGAPTEGEVLLAEAICARVEGCEQVRLVSSGTEATMSAVRVARGFTGRSRIVKFAGCYHGHSDGHLAGGGSGVATLGLPDSAGVPLGAVAETIVAPYNQVPELDDRVACVIVEPVAANMGLVAPVPGFLEGLRSACDRVGALLVFDEVITGFRLGQGGAAAWSGVRPDLWCFGKVIGGGLPVGAFGGRGDVLACLAPDGPVYQAGTLSGNPLATAAGLAVLSNLDGEDYRALSERVTRFGAELEEVLSAGLSRGGVVDAAGDHLEARVPVVGPLVGLFFVPVGSPPVERYEGAAASAATGLYARLFRAMLARGVALAPGPYEVAFPSMAHGDTELKLALEAASDAFSQVVAEAVSDARSGVASRG
jgi:glutamate-1-semialdehyde 2,1-aminomutase